MNSVAIENLITENDLTFKALDQNVVPLRIASLLFPHLLNYILHGRLKERKTPLSFAPD